MANPGDIVGVISLAAQIIEIAVKFGQDWKDVPSEVRKFLAELQALKLALKELDDNVVRNPDVIAALDGRHSALLSQLGDQSREKTMDKATGEDEDAVAADSTPELQVLLTLCRTELRKVLAELRKRSEGSRFGWERFAAAFRVKGVRQCVLDLHRECQQLNMMMTIDSIAMQAKTSLKVTELGETQQKLHAATMEELNDWRDEDREATSNLQAGVDHLTKETSDRLPMFDQLVSSHTDKEKEALIQWFSNIQADEKHTHILKNRQAGTCSYFLESPAFKKWVDGDEAKLWCIGAPGTGKTILAAAAIDTLEAKCVHSQVGKAFIYCNYAERSEQSIEQLLGSLIQQLLRQCKIPDHISQLYNKSSGKRPDANELASHLQQVISKFSTIYIVIDALDECEDVNKTRSTLLSHMKSLPAQVRIMFTSRPLGEVDTLQTAQKFEVVAQAEDIHKYIVAQMARESHLIELCAKDAALERDIVDQISQKAGGMFLLAILHFRAVSSQLRLKTVRKVLAKLPVGIKDTYDDTVERIQKGQKREQSELAMNVLMLLTHAVEPLNVEQIQHALLALELDEDEEEIDTNDVYDKALLVTICGGLIVVEAETSAIRFVHHTAESYFEDHDKVLFRNGAETMGSMCLAYISLDEFKSGSCQDDDELDERVRSYPLYRYAATNLGKHLGPDAYSDRILEILHSKPLIAGVTQMLVEYALLGKGGSGRKKDLTSQSPFQAAASNGLVKVIRKFISDGQDLDDLEEFGVSALGMAILRDFPEAARVLIESGANVELASTNAQTTFTRRTPFFFAAARGYSDLVAMMLERGANVNAKLDTSHLSRRFEVRETLNGRIYYVDHLYMTTSWEDPRPKAALDDDDDIPGEELEKGRFERRFKENGRPYYVDHLLRRTTWTNPVQDRKAPSRASKEASGPSALGMAAFEGHEDTVKVLLAADGIDVNAKDADGRTALSLAAASGHKAVVQALLDAPGVDPDIEDVHERTALSYAAAAPHGEIGIMLLEKGKAKPMSASRKHRSPLAFAVHRSQEKLARALLDSLGPDKEAAVNQRDYEMTLGWEVQRSIDGVALYRDRLDHRSRALSPQQDQHGDRSRNDDTTGNTVLMYAAASGNPECVEMLLRAGAEVDARDSFGRTPLMFAATDGHRDAIKVLLELGKADALLMDSVGNTAGYYAVKEKHRDIIGLLPVVGAWGTDLSPPVVDAHSRFAGVADDSWESDGSWETEGEGDIPTEQGDESTNQGEESTAEAEEAQGVAIDEQVGEQASKQTPS